MAFAFIGDTGIGKTYNLMHMLKCDDYFSNIVLCRTIHDLKKVTDSTTDIIFDDIDFRLGPPEVLINLCDKDFPGSVRVLYGTATIRPDICKWFTSNSKSAFQPILATFSQQRAINRRIKFIEVDTREEVIEEIKKCQKLHHHQLRSTRHFNAM